MTSIWSDVLTNLAVARKMSTDQLQEIADQFSSRSAKGALAAGMIDKIAYYDEVLSDLKKLPVAVRKKRKIHHPPQIQQSICKIR